MKSYKNVNVTVFFSDKSAESVWEGHKNEVECNQKLHLQGPCRTWTGLTLG